MDLMRNVSSADNFSLSGALENSTTVVNCELYKFVFYTVVIGSLCILGVTGNIVSIVVLRRDRTSQVAAFLLEALAVSDSLVLVVSFFVLSVVYGLSSYFGAGVATRTMLIYVRKYVTPLAYMTQNATIWMTVLLAVNRYIAVCRPFSAATVCTLRNAKLQVAGVAVLSVVFNTPRFFQYRIDVVQTSTNTTSLRLMATAIGEQTLFGKIYTNALYTLVVLLLPWLLLLGLNTRLMLTLRSARRRRDKFVHGRCAAPDEANISLVMVIIVVAFLVFHTPDRLLQVAKEFSRPDQFRCGRLLYFVSGVCTLLIILNSSTNFLIYYTWRRRFRKIFMLTFCRPPAAPRYGRHQAAKTAHQLALLPYTHPTVPSSHSSNHTSSHASSSHSSNHAPGNASCQCTRNTPGSGSSGQTHRHSHCCGFAQCNTTSQSDCNNVTRSLR